VQHVRPPQLAGSELTYLQTTVGAVPPDVRSMLEVIVVDESDKTVVHRGKEHWIRSGVVGVRSAYEVGRLVRRNGPSRVRIIGLANDELQAAFDAVHVEPRSVEPAVWFAEDKGLQAAASAVFSAVESHAPTMAVQTRLVACALNVVRTLTKRENDAPRNLSSAERIREVLHDRMSEDLTLDDLARDVGLSRTYVVHAFRRVFHLPPYEYLMHIRVAKARDMLAAGGRPVDVAHTCGFCDQSHLNRWFRAAVGVTPGQYRGDTPAKRGPHTG
jgi:AraC-like DNA-binding protein